jgi:DNA mismatch repair protein MutL
MPRIQQLSPTLVNQIAAGEVVERPASVVKELLENSVDAGARRIEVEVARGGTDLIQVVDDGCGIEPEDLPLTFASHATSKLSCSEDLFRIGTLGFRGEALASVGSIAQVRLQSRPAGQAHGAEITCHGGQLGEVAPWNGSPGTRIEVRHLFYNVPARRKFLKAAGTEMGHVSEVFTRLALAHLGVHWSLKHNGRLVHETPASMGLLDRIGLFFGTEVQNSLHMVEGEEEGVTLGGYVGDPSCDQAGTQLQYLFLNGRWVRDRGLFQAVQDAYQGLLMVQRYPVAFLFLDVPPERVDVNVHPAKSEVRFRDKDALYELVRQVVREGLHRADLTARAQLRTRKERPPDADSGAGLPSRPVPPASGPPAREERPPASMPCGMPAAARTTPPPSTPQAARPPAAIGGLFPTPVGGGEACLTPSPREGTAPSSAAQRDVPKAMQVLDCYLVVEEQPDEVLWIDQHALHERILFEQLKAGLTSGTLSTQRLLIPEPVTLPPAQAALVLEHRKEMAGLGLAVEDFGGGTVLLAGYPALLGKRPPRDIFQAVVDHLASRGRPPSREQLLNDLLSLMACHAAVRAGDRLTPEEIAALLAQRQVAQDSHHCPHGRPTALRFSRHDLEKMFKRV